MIWPCILYVNSLICWLSQSCKQGREGSLKCEARWLSLASPGRWRSVVCGACGTTAPSSGINRHCWQTPYSPLTIILCLKKHSFNSWLLNKPTPKCRQSFFLLVNNAQFIINVAQWEDIYTDGFFTGAHLNWNVKSVSSGCDCGNRTFLVQCRKVAKISRYWQFWPVHLTMQDRSNQPVTAEYRLKISFEGSSVFNQCSMSGWMKE